MRCRCQKIPMHEDAASLRAHTSHSERTWRFLSTRTLPSLTLSEVADDEAVCGILFVAHAGPCAALKIKCLKYIQCTFGVSADDPTNARDHLQPPGWRERRAKTPALRPDLDHVPKGL